MGFKIVSKNRLSSKVFEVEQLIKNLSTEESSEKIIEIFESIDENYRDQNATHLYLKIWKIALANGKLNLANQYAKKGMDYLIEQKRVPSLKTFVNELKLNGILKKDQKQILNLLDIMQGSKKTISDGDLIHFELLATHPEQWKKSSTFLGQYLNIEEGWEVEQWKLCYEFILNFQFDKDLYLILIQKAELLDKKKYKKMFEAYFSENNIKYKKIKESLPKENRSQSKKLNIDYDELAYDVLSGAISSEKSEQDKIVSSLRFIEDNELKLKGLEMIVAFEFLGMDQAVLFLCQKILPMLTNVKDRASCYYIWAQTLVTKEEYYNALDLIEDVLNKEPVYGDELVAFSYLKAEAYFYLKKYKLAI